MITLCGIVAMDKNRAIGKNNTIPWRLKDDMKFFKETTLGYPVIMGRKTWESFPKRPLVDRDNIVITSAESLQLLDFDRTYHHTPSLSEAFDIASCQSHVVFVIGGERVYNSYLPMLDTLFVSHVDVEIEGADTFFPEFRYKSYETIARFEKSEANEYNFEIRKYKLNE